MTPVARRKAFALALFPPCAAALWLIAAPGSVATLTYVMAATLLAAMGAIVVTTWRNGQATGSIGQLLHETDLRRAPQTTGREGSPIENALP